MRIPIAEIPNQLVADPNIASQASHAEMLRRVWSWTKPARPSFKAYLARHVAEGCPLHEGLPKEQAAV